MTKYVQAWECKGPKFSGFVYTQRIALDKLADGCDIETVTIVRHDDGSREYLRGTIASEVQRYRTIMPSMVRVGVPDTREGVRTMAIERFGNGGLIYLWLANDYTANPYWLVIVHRWQDAFDAQGNRT